MMQNDEPIPPREETAGNGEAEAADDAIEDRTEALEREVAALKDQLLRKAAEFENFRKRTRDEQADLARYANERLIAEQLPVLDDLARSLAAGREHPNFETFFAGIELVYIKWMKILEARGLKPIASAGRPFDVEFHDALLQLPRADLAPGTIIDEIESGYLLHDRVLRHAKVTVAAEPPAAEGAGTP
jgi:molecular chaperone GrpE